MKRSGCSSYHLGVKILGSYTGKEVGNSHMKRSGIIIVLLGVKISSSGSVPYRC